MKKKIIKSMIVASISLLILSSSFTNLVSANKVDMTIVKKYNTNEKIFLGNNPIEIPKKCIEQEEEFRGVWVSSVYNLDFPSKKGLSKEAYKKEYIEVLDNLQALNMNSIIFQVRPKSDAFYKSKINPWSEYLTGKEGLDPGWDPLEWMIEETHNRNMEFHAWFNPYRVTTAFSQKTKLGKLEELSRKNWARNNPDKVLDVDGKLYLNPGEPEVIDHLNKSLMEVVENYDVDAIHLDDYFYPNRSVDQKDKAYTYEEKLSFEKHGKDFEKMSDWRRFNVDKLIESLSDSLKEYNIENDKNVEFGISPFGIWGHEKNHPEGSTEGRGSKTPTSSLASYDNQFADTRKWVKNNWVDYIAPQIYWSFDQKAAPYGELVDWWSNVVKETNVKLYIGHGNYKKSNINNKELAWKNPREISNQMKFNGLYDEVDGSIFFRYKSLLKDQGINLANNEFIDILLNEHYHSPAKLPSKKIIENKEIKSAKIKNK